MMHRKKAAPLRLLRTMLCMLLLTMVLILAAPLAHAQVVPEDYRTVSPFTGKTYQHNAVHAGNTIVQAIDVSQWNTIKDWNAVKNAGIEYVFVRVGNRYSGSGSLDYDTRYKTNIQGALDAGLQVGVYFYSQAISVEEGRAEAEYTLELIEGYDITLPVVMDFEYYCNTYGNNDGRLYHAGLSRQAKTDIVLAFCDVVSDAGYSPMVYANKSMLTSDLYADQISAVAKIWMAHYTTADSYSSPHFGWQYSDKGSVPGISGSVDCNFFYVPTSTSEPVNPTLPEAPSVDEDDLPDLEDILYFVDGYEEGTTYGEIFKDVEEDLEAAGLYIAFCDLEGNFLAEDDVIRTNDMAVIFDDEANIYEVDIFVLRGDVNCDGVIDIFDPMDMYLYFNDYLTLEGGAVIACDFNADDEEDIFDPMDVYLYLNR